MKKKIIKICSAGIAITLMVALVLLSLPASVAISQDGLLAINPNIAFAQEGPIPIGEVIEKRTKNSKTYYIGGDIYSWDGTIGKIHYEDNGWQEIDNEFTPASELSPWDWEMLKAGYNIRVLEDFTAGQIIEFEKQGETVAFQPMALEWTNDLDQIQSAGIPQGVVPVIINTEVDLLPTIGLPSHQGAIRWNNAYGDGLDFQWKCTSTRLTKILEVESFSKLPTLQQYIIDGGNPVLRLNLIFDPSKDIDIIIGNEVWNKNTKTQTFNAVEFQKNGEILWGFMPLRFWDSQDNKGQSVATLEKRGNKLYISIRVPYEWLQTAIYPIFIDADVDEYVVAGADDASENYGGITVENDFNRVACYYTTSNNQHYRSGIRWTSVNVAKDAEITAAYVSGNVWSTAYDDPKLNIYGNDVDSAVDFDADSNVLSRARTDGTGVDGDGSVAWVATGIGAGWKACPSIVNIIQEIVNRASWAANNNLCVLFIGQTVSPAKTLIWLSYDWDSGNAGLLHIEYSVAEPDIANTPSSKAFGILELSASAWSSGSAPSWPLDDGECFFEITNNGDAATITIEATDFTGTGTDWTLDGPGANAIKMKAGISGDVNEEAMVILTNSPQTFVSGLAGSGTKQWEIKLEMPTSSDKYEKTSTITLIATLD